MPSTAASLAILMMLLLGWSVGEGERDSLEDGLGVGNVPEADGREVVTEPQVQVGRGRAFGDVDHQAYLRRGDEEEAALRQCQIGHRLVRAAPDAAQAQAQVRKQEVVAASVEVVVADG